MANVALGKRVLELISRPEAATDGNVTDYTGREGFAYLAWPGTLTVDLEDVYNIRCVRVLLWDGLGRDAKIRDFRRYKYRLLLSDDGQKWLVAYDTVDQGFNGWQVFQFPDGYPTRFVRLHCLWNSANIECQIVQVEAHDSDPQDQYAQTTLNRTIGTREVPLEIRDGAPLVARVQQVIAALDEIQARSNNILNPKLIGDLKAQLSNRAFDLDAVERSMESIRREIIEPVHKRLGNLTSQGTLALWITAAGGLLSLVGLLLWIFGE